MILKDLAEWINAATSRGAVPVITGRNGDMDTVGSAIALAASEKNMLACGLHLSRVSKKICEDLSAPFKKIGEKPNWPKPLGGIIIVDAASEGQTGIDIPRDVPICVIDHHDTSDWKFKPNDLEIRTNARSTTQIVFNYLDENSKDVLTNEVRKLLLAGLITDTGRFKHADESALRCAADIMSGADFDYQTFIERIQSENITASDRGAIVKALSRCEMKDCGPWNLVSTYAGIHEGKIATILMQTGADVSFVSRFRNGETRITARAPRSSTKSGLHLGEIMQRLSVQLGGEGGGHDGAAGWSGKQDRISAESAFINILSQIRRDDDES